MLSQAVPCRAVPCRALISSAPPLPRLVFRHLSLSSLPSSCDVIVESQAKIDTYSAGSTFISFIIRVATSFSSSTSSHPQPLPPLTITTPLPRPPPPPLPPPPPPLTHLAVQ
eukprot:746551-Hanusia_phi.AAC.4